MFGVKITIYNCNVELMANLYIIWRCTKTGFSMRVIQLSITTNASLITTESHGENHALNI